VEMTTPTLMIRRIGKGYCAAGDGFYCFDEELSRVLQRVAEFSRRTDPRSSESEATEARAEAAPKA
jgi:hypothetical protein